LISKGEWAEAEEELTRAIDELKTLKPASVSLGMLRLAELRRRQGEWTEATAIFNEVKAGSNSLSRAALLYDMGEFNEAFEITERILRHVPDHERTERIPVLELFIQICVRLKEMKLAEKSMHELESIARELNILPLHAACKQARGTLHHGQGNNDLARNDLEGAIDLFEQLGAPFESARTRVVLGAVLVALHKDDLAETEVNLAIKSFKKLGAVRDMEKARQQLKELGLGVSNDQGFTRRELDLLRLVSDGKNNEEIADTLSISLRTVEKHLSNIYEKLGTSGKSARAHAASFATRKLFKG
jgi:ATP/maltotriose-dependent transcriptional regulator MalT